MALDWKEILLTETKEERRLIRRFDCGVTVHRQNRSLIVIPPTMNWRAVSSGSFNGGFMSSPSAVFNTTSLGGHAQNDLMFKPREVHEKYSMMCAELVDLDPSTSIGLGTAAHMDNAALGSRLCDGIEVCATITGGIRGNGGRAGDPASYDEMERNMERSGTIVIILSIDASLSDDAMLGAMMTATEAKSKALLKVMGRSLYSTGIATGSGTDQVVVLCNKGSDRKVSGHRNDSKLADAIRDCVEVTLAEALDRQSMMNSQTQCNPYVLISRYRIAEKDCHDEIVYPFTMRALRKGVEELSRDSRVAAVVSTALHVMDEVGWGLISKEVGDSACRQILISSLRGPSMDDPILRKRMRSLVEPVDLLRMFMAMLLFDRAHAMEDRQSQGVAT